MKRDRDVYRRRGRVYQARPKWDLERATRRAALRRNVGIGVTILVLALASAVFAYGLVFALIVTLS